MLHDGAWTPENAGCGGQRERKTPGLVLKESVNRNVLRLYSCACRVDRVATSTCYTVLPGRERGPAPAPGCRCCLVTFRPPVLYWEDVCCGLERWTHRRMMHTRLGTRLHGSCSSSMAQLVARRCTPCSHPASFVSHCGFGMLREQKEEGRVRGRWVAKPGGGERIGSSRRARSSEGRAP